MKITRGYKTELDPTVKQYLLLCQCAGAARFAYNYGLARKLEVYKETGRRISAIDLQKELTARKHADLPWLKNASKWIVQNALRDLDQAYDNFFRRLTERKAGKKHKRLSFPKFKKKNAEKAERALDKLAEVADAGKNTFPALLEAAEVCSLGQITGRLQEVVGRFRPMV